MGKLPSASFRGTDRFQILRPLGRGGMGQVFAVTDRERGATVALKTLNQMSTEGLLLFKNEFRALADIHHENLVSLYELVEEKGQWFFTMEWVQGTDFVSFVCPRPEGTAEADAEDGATSDLPAGPLILPAATPPLTPQSTPGVPSQADSLGSAPSASLAYQQLPHDGQLDETKLRSALVQLGRGLGALHAAHKIHRDIKPQNVMVTPQGRVVILDFGIIQDREPNRHQRHQQARGTALYMAPEQALGTPITPAADFYSVGIMLYQALTAQLPFLGLAEEILTAKATKVPCPPRVLAPSISPDLDQLCQDLLAIDPTRRPIGEAFLRRLNAPAFFSDGPAPTTASQLNLFIGRSKELAALNDSFASARQGRALTLLVHGESGIGKSFLVKHFLNSVLAQTPQALVLHGRCYERESVPYKAVDMVIDQLSHYLQLLPDADLQLVLPPQAGGLGALFPVMVPLVERIRSETNLDAVRDPLQQRNRAFEALRLILWALSKRAPVVVAIDDLQWADADSMALLTTVLQPPEAPPFLLLATLRTSTTSEGVRPASPGLVFAGEVRHLLIEKLPAADANELAFQLLGPGTNRATAALIAAEAHGHPLFIDELSRQQQLVRKEQPALRLDDALWMRIERLDRDSRRLIEVVAVAGIPIAQGVAAQAALLESGEIENVVRSLRSGHLIRTQGPRLSDVIEAYHDRIRESVLARLSAAARSAWHGHLAVALESGHQPDPELLMVHWSGAGQPDRAARYAVKAAEQSQKALAFERAARLYAQALALGAATPEERRTFLTNRAVCLANGNRGGEAATAFVQAAQGADERTARGLQRQATEQYLRSGHTEEGVTELRKVMSALGLSYPKNHRQAILRLILRRVQLSLYGKRIKIRPADAISELDRERMETCWMAGKVLSATDVLIGYAFNAQSALLALRHGQADYIGLGLAWEATNHLVGGGAGIAAGHAALERARELGRTLTSPILDACVAQAEGLLHLFAGNFQQARTAFAQSTAIFEERCHGKAHDIDFNWLMILACDKALADFVNVRRHLFRMIDEAEARGDRYQVANLLTDSACHFYIREDDPAESRRQIEKGLTGWTSKDFDVVHSGAYAMQSEVDLYEGHGVAALQRTTDTLPKMKRTFLLTISMVRQQIYYVQGRAALLAIAEAGSTPARLRLVEDAAHRLEKEADAWMHSFAYLIRAGQSALRGDRAGAITWWRRAAESFSRLDMVAHAAAARWRLGQAQGGTEGSRVMAEALQQIHVCTVRNPARYAAFLAPSG